MKIFIAAVFLFLCLVPLVTQAQEKSSIEVTADQALSWDRANSLFSAKGNAVVTQGQNTVSAPEIVAHYEGGDKAMAITQIVAGPDAVLKQPDQTLKADQVTADFNKGLLSTVIAEGHVVLKTDKETLYGDKGTYDALKRIIIVTGNVKIEQGKNILTGSRAEFDMNTSVSTMTTSAKGGERVKAVFYGKEEQ